MIAIAGVWVPRWEQQGRNRGDRGSHATGNRDAQEETEALDSSQRRRSIIRLCTWHRCVLTSASRQGQVRVFKGSTGVETRSCLVLRRGRDTGAAQHPGELQGDTVTNGVVLLPHLHLRVLELARSSTYSLRVREDHFKTRQREVGCRDRILAPVSKDLHSELGEMSSRGTGCVQHAVLASPSDASGVSIHRKQIFKN